MKRISNAKFKDIAKGLALIGTLGVAGGAGLSVAGPSGLVHAKGVGMDKQFAPGYRMHSTKTTPDNSWGYENGFSVNPGTFDTDGDNSLIAFCRTYYKWTPSKGVNTYDGTPHDYPLHVLECGWPANDSKTVTNGKYGNDSYQIARAATQMAYWQAGGAGRYSFSVNGYTPGGLHGTLGREAKSVAQSILKKAKNMTGGKEPPKPKFVPLGNYPKDSFETYQGYKLEGLDGYKLEDNDTTLTAKGLPKGAYLTINHKSIGGNGSHHATLQDNQVLGVHIPKADASGNQHYKWNVTLSGKVPFVYAANYQPPSGYDEQKSTVVKKYNMPGVQIGNDYTNTEKHPTPPPTPPVQPGELLVTKEDTDGNVMAGTKLSLYREQTDGSYKDVGDATTDSNGHAYFPNLDTGTYLVREDSTDAEHKITKPDGSVVEKFVNVTAGQPSSITLTDQKIADMPHLKSFVSEDGTEDHDLDAKTQTLHDELDLYHLDAGHTYYVEDQLMDADTGAPAQINGKTYGNSETFTAGENDIDSNNGGNPQQAGTSGDKVNHQVPIHVGDVPFANMQNHRYYMQAMVKANNDNGQILYMERSDIDKNQNIRIKNPWATSKLVNKTWEHYDDGSADKDQNKSYLDDVNPDKNQDLTDTFTEHGLVSGHSYTLNAQLMAKGSDGKYTKIPDSAATQSKTFKATDSDMHNSVDFNGVDLSKYKRQDVVVFYKLTPDDQTSDNLIDYTKGGYFGENTETLHVTNPKQITVNKVDTKGKKLPHTKFTIYRKDKDGHLVSIKSAETDSNGQLTFDNLEPAVYVIREDSTDKEHETSDDNGDNQEQTVDASDINTTNYNITFTDAPIADQPDVQSHTTEAGTGSRKLDAKKEDLQDDVDTTHLDGTHQYKVVDTLMDGKTNKAVDDKGNDTDDNSKAASTSKTITAPGRHGEHTHDDFTLKFPEVDFSGHQNQHYYTQVKIYNDDGKLLRVEQSPHDVDQNLFVEQPVATTQARSKVDKDDVTGEQHVNPYSKTDLVDHAKTKNLVRGHEYTLHEQVMEKDGSSVKPLKSDGSDVTATKDIKADDTEMSTDVDFGKFSTEGLAGKDLVIYYKITPKSQEDDKLASLTDKDNKDETIQITNPKIHTVANIDGAKASDPSDDSRITDTVTYSGVAPNQPMDMAAIAANKDHRAIEVKDPKGGHSLLMGKTKFTPQEESGDVDVPLQEVAASSGSDDTKDNKSGADSGKSVSSAASSSQSSLDVSEDSSTYASAKSLSASSSDADDDAEAGPDVDSASVRHSLNDLTPISNAAAKANDDPSEAASEEDKDLGESEKAATDRANADRSPFDIDTEGLQGQDIHLLEDAYMDGDDTPFASYTSVNDDDETVHITKPLIYTEALLDQHKESNPSSKSFLQDRVKYVNVKPGQPLTASTLAINTKTGQPIVIHEKGNSYNLMGRKTFTPTAPNGEVDVPLQMVQAGYAAKNDKGTSITPANDKKVAVKSAKDDPTIKSLADAADKLDTSNKDLSGDKDDLTSTINYLGGFVYDAQTGLPQNIHDDAEKIINSIGDGKKVDAGNLSSEISQLSSDIDTDDDNGDLVKNSQYKAWKDDDPTSGSDASASSSADSSAASSSAASAPTSTDDNAASYIVGDDGAQASNGTSSTVSSASSVASDNSKAASSSSVSSSAADTDYATSSDVMNRVGENHLPLNSDSDEGKDADNEFATDDPHNAKYAIDTRALRGQTMTMFEDITNPADHNSSPVTTDANAANMDESVRITNPQIHTLQQINGKKNGKPGHEDDDHLTDKVTFKDFAPDETAHMEAVEMDKGTGKPVMIDNQYLVGRQTFKPKDHDGSVTVNFEKQTEPPMYQFLVRELGDDGNPSSDAANTTEDTSQQDPKDVLKNAKDADKNDVKPDTKKQKSNDNANAVADNADDNDDYEAGSNDQADNDDVDEDTDSSRNGIDLSSLLKNTGLYGKTLHWTAFETAQNDNGDDIAEHKDLTSPDQSVGVTVLVPPKKKPVKNPTPVSKTYSASSPSPAASPSGTYGARPGTNGTNSTSTTPGHNSTTSTPALGGTYPQYARTGASAKRHVHKHAKRGFVHKLVHGLKDLF